MAKKKSPKSRPHTQLKPEAIDLSKLPSACDSSLRLTWVDRMELSTRSDIPVCMMRFYSGIPRSELQEVARLQLATTHARAIVDVLCRSLDYYPDKKKLGEKDGKGKAKKR